MDERLEGAKPSNVPAEKGEWVCEMMWVVIRSFCLLLSKSSWLWIYIKQGQRSESERFPLMCNVSFVLCACRLIYWLCLSLGSTIRGLGFGLSFLPILVMLGVNLYYVCSSVGQGSVFDIEQPTMAPPPRQRWWGWRAEATLRDKQLWGLFNIITPGQTTWLVILVSF